jgi:beta-xylosidase
MFVTLTGADGTRGTASFVSDCIEGPYAPWSDGYLTPSSLMTLDGTLYVDKKGDPWMIYCHEWLQTVDGAVGAIPLSYDLKGAAGDPVHLFNASGAPWAKGGYCESYGGVEYKKHIYVTDGPYMFYDLSGALCMIWTTCNDVYTTGVSRSLSGDVTGPWVHSEKPLFSDDGGHAMLFKTLDGKDMLAMHRPHTVKDRSERLALVPVFYTETGLGV